MGGFGSNKVLQSHVAAVQQRGVTHTDGIYSQTHTHTNTHAFFKCSFCLRCCLASLRRCLDYTRCDTGRNITQNSLAHQRLLISWRPAATSSCLSCLVSLAPSVFLRHTHSHTPAHNTAQHRKQRPGQQPIRLYSEQVQHVLLLNDWMCRLNRRLVFASLWWCYISDWPWNMVLHGSLSCIKVFQTFQTLWGDNSNSLNQIIGTKPCTCISLRVFKRATVRICEWHNPNTWVVSVSLLCCITAGQSSYSLSGPSPHQFPVCAGSFTVESEPLTRQQPRHSLMLQSHTRCALHSERRWTHTPRILLINIRAFYRCRRLQKDEWWTAEVSFVTTVFILSPTFNSLKWKKIWS